MRLADFARASAELMLLFASLLLCMVFAAWLALWPRAESGRDRLDALTPSRHQPR